MWNVTQLFAFRLRKSWSLVSPIGYSPKRLAQEQTFMSLDPILCPPYNSHYRQLSTSLSSCSSSLETALDAALCSSICAFDPDRYLQVYGAYRMLGKVEVSITDYILEQCTVPNYEENCFPICLSRLFGIGYSRCHEFIVKLIRKYLLYSYETYFIKKEAWFLVVVSAWLIGRAVYNFLL